MGLLLFLPKKLLYNNLREHSRSSIIHVSAGGKILVVLYHIIDIYLMAVLLSATAEKNPAFAWDLNMNSLFHVLNLAKAKKIKNILPSSIGVFGPTTPK